MEDNKINMEHVEGGKGMVVCLISRMASLSQDERQQIEDCLPETGKQTIRDLFDNLRAAGHDELAEKIAPYLQQGTLGPVFGNATAEVQLRDEAPVLFLDEFGPSPEEIRQLHRISMRDTFVGGWAIGEQFDERYDTEVGGNQLLITQSINEKGELEGGLPSGMTIEQFAEIPKQLRPPQIVDYQEDKHYSLEEAEVIPELAQVVERLKARIAEYAEKIGR